MNSTPVISYVVEPRFPGGTSAAIARELRTTSRFGKIEVHAISSKMLDGQPVAPRLQEALNDLKLEMIWDAPQISGDLVILHNPSFLKFQQCFDTRIVTRNLLVVTHENFLRPGGYEGFDVCKCLDLIERSSLALRRSIAPVSKFNRETATEWLGNNPQGRAWDVLDEDWFNICDFVAEPPCEAPQDRRGRHSRPGVEKFPSLSDMDACFPAHAAANVILGADPFIKSGLVRPHWQAHPFQGIEVEEYFSMIDFMVYFTAPTLRESFGRVLAEGIAAGKVVISDPGTASEFDGAVISSRPQDVDKVISEFIAKPERYSRHVNAAQSILNNYSAERFAGVFCRVMQSTIGSTA